MPGAGSAHNIPGHAAHITRGSGYRNISLDSGNISQRYSTQDSLDLTTKFLSTKFRRLFLKSF
jgi:hypothetical protein